MPKMKSRRGAAKRLKITKSGKIKAKKANLRHILTSKDPKRKRQLRKRMYIAAVDEARVLKMLPYG
ncbi:MAG TPA: 50S ribosomal protein L35 [Oligoflexia bacterium]|nr:50S ribosomal protein L35 [Oligoflexia bacterium]HMR24109.1 50S ribosomal protein L35 [Oligoflexia bacterium]